MVEFITKILSGIIGLFLICLCLAAYFFPTIVARNKRNGCAVGLVNLIFGWTGLGWIIALIWASMNDAVPVVVHDSPQKDGAQKICPKCAESVKKAAEVCRFCGHQFVLKNEDYSQTYLASQPTDGTTISNKQKEEQQFPPMRELPPTKRPTDSDPFSKYNED